MTELAPVKHYVVQALETFEQAKEDERKGRFPQAAQGIAKAHYILDEYIPSLPDYSRFCAHTPNPFLDSYKQLRGMVAVSMPAKPKLESESLPTAATDDLTLRFQKLRGSHSAPKPPSALTSPKGSARASPGQSPSNSRRTEVTPPRALSPGKALPPNQAVRQNQPHQPHQPQPQPQQKEQKQPRPELRRTPSAEVERAGSASVDTVGCWLRNMKHQLLFLDVRDRAAYDAGHVDAPIICCLEPVSLRANMSDSELEDSLVIAPEAEMDAFSMRALVQKVIVYTDSARAGAEMDPPLSYVYSALQRAGIKPVLLAGGYDAWMRAGHKTAVSPSATDAEPERVEKPTQDVAEDFAQELDRELAQAKEPAAGSATSASSERSPFALPAAVSGDWVVKNGRLEQANGVSPRFSPHFSSHSSNRSVSPYVNGHSSLDKSRFPLASGTSNGTTSSNPGTTPSANGASANANGSRVPQPMYSPPPVPQYQHTPVQYPPPVPYTQPQQPQHPQYAQHPQKYAPLQYAPHPQHAPHAPHTQYTPHPQQSPHPQHAPHPQQLQQYAPQQYAPHGHGAISAPFNARYATPAQPIPLQRPPVPMAHMHDMHAHAHEPERSTVVSTPWPKNQTYHPALSYLTGLRNLGNTCYMNCVIQCLSGTPQLAVPFLDKSFQKHVNPKSRLGYQGRLANEYAALVKAMARAGNGYVAAKGIKKLAGRLQDTFEGTDQQDCQEFLVFLLDGLHEDLNENGHLPRQPELGEREERVRERYHVRLASAIEWERYLKSDTSLIVDTFQGQYLSRLQCTVCGTTSTTYTAFSTLSLPLVSGHRIDLLDCFNQFVAPEILDGDDAWHCPSCQRRQRTIKTMTISCLPPVLIIHLKRFRRTMYSVDKLETAITYPLHHLDLTRYWPNPPIENPDHARELEKLPKRGQEPPFIYDLYAVTAHDGTLKGGHYTAYVNKPNHGWCHYDDVNVTRVPERAAVTSKAYLLFYQRV